MKKNKSQSITFVRLEDTPFGGAENYLRRVITQLQARGIPHQIKHSKSPKWLASWLRALWFDRETTWQKKGQFYFSLARISCPDIYRAGDGVHKAYRALVGKFSLNPLHLVYLWLERRCFLRAKKIIANSKMVKEEILTHYPIDPSKITVVYNGISLPSYEEQDAKKALAKEFNFDPAIPIILFVGSGFRRKGVAPLLALLSQVKRPFTALVVGKEKKLRHYQALRKQLGLEKKVIFTGLRQDVATFYAASDLFIYPALYEPFPNVALEALSFGSVVFASDKTGICEQLPAEQRFSLESIDKIIPDIECLLSYPEMLCQAKKNARQLAKNFTIEKNVEQTLAVIEEVMQDGNKSA